MVPLLMHKLSHSRAYSISKFVVLAWGKFLVIFNDYESNQSVWDASLGFHKFHAGKS